MKKIAITGGLASGKSTVCSLLKEQGAYHVSGDEIAHNLLKIHQKSIIEAFGTINRGELAQLVFSDRKKLRRLETILHPPLLEEVVRQMEKAQKENVAFFMCELAILFEKGWETYFDETITVLTTEEVALKRYKLQGHTSQEYKMRMQHQLSPEEKAARSSRVITNNGTYENLKTQLKGTLDESRE